MGEPEGASKVAEEAERKAADEVERNTAASIADVRIGKYDRLGKKITEVYQRKDQEYAVYRTEDRVQVYFADDPAMGKEQRRVLAPLLPLRDEIEGLIQSWRAVTEKPETHGFFGLRDYNQCKKKVETQDRGVAGALVQAFEDDATGARLMLEKIKSDLTNERVAFARFEYLLTAFTTALIVMFGAWLLASLLPVTNPEDVAIPARLVNGIALFSQSALAVAVVGVGLTAAGRLKKSGLERVLLALLAIPLIALLIYRFFPALAAIDVLVTRAHAVGMIAILLAAALWLAFITARKPSSWRRAALVFTIVAIPLFALLIWPQTPAELVRADYEPGVRMWRGFAAGTVGAFFSIALAIKGRTVLPDLLRTANMMDALLRVAIGAIGGAVLIALIDGRVVTFPLVSRTDPLFTLIAGFFAGFSERLVPDLLAKVSEKSVVFDAQMAASRAQREEHAEKRVERHDAAKTGAIAAEAANDDKLPDDDVEVGPEGFRLQDDEVTQDEELPATMGGVAKA